MLSSDLCADIFALLTPSQRKLLKAIGLGEVGTVSMWDLGKLKSLALIHHDGNDITLTAVGQAIAMFC